MFNSIIALNQRYLVFCRIFTKREDKNPIFILVKFIGAKYLVKISLLPPKYFVLVELFFFL